MININWNIRIHSEEYKAKYWMNSIFSVYTTPFFIITHVGWLNINDTVSRTTDGKCNHYKNISRTENNPIDIWKYLFCE